jgi:hypothetical protein
MKQLMKDGDYCLRLKEQVKEQLCGAGLNKTIMKHIFTLSLCCLALSLSAQETITYPYNPDGNADGTITVPDLQDFLGNYGSLFSPAEIMVGDTALGEWIQILYQALEDQQAVIEAMQGASTSGYQSIQEDSIFVVPQGINTLYINLIGAAGGNGQNTDVLYSNSTSIQYALAGCSGGNPMSVDLILNCHPGDSIIIDFGAVGNTPPTQTVGNVYSSASANGSDGGMFNLSVNSLNVLSVSGGLGGSGITWNGMNFSCWNGPGADGTIIYPEGYFVYPMFVTGARLITSSMEQNQVLIKY